MEQDGGEKYKVIYYSASGGRRKQPALFGHSALVR